jgi:hypothetical protein
LAVALEGGVGVVGPLYAGRRALLAGEIGRAGTRNQEQFFPLPGQVLDRQRHRGIDALGDDVDIFIVDPVAHDGDRDIRLVLMVCRNDFDAAARDRSADLFRRHLRRNDRPRTIAVGILTAHVGHDADAQHAFLGVREVCNPERQQPDRDGTSHSKFHEISS